MFSQILPTTMRQSKATVRFSDPEYVARPRHILLKPFQGQPRKYAKRIFRLPEVSIKKSSIPNAGFGLYIRENVRKGQIISIYRRRIISESDAQLLKKKVPIDSATYFPSCIVNSELCTGQSTHSSQSCSMQLLGFAADPEGRLRLFKQHS